MYFCGSLDIFRVFDIFRIVGSSPGISVPKYLNQPKSEIYSKTVGILRVLEL